MMDDRKALRRRSRCRECDFQTGGGEFCFRHAPYMVTPKKDGTFVVDRNGRRRVAFDEPPSPAEEIATFEARIAELEGGLFKRIKRALAGRSWR